MPSWNEKAHVVPSINVNLKPCDCSKPSPREVSPDLVNDHWSTCPGKPVLVPLPLEPWRSVTMTVRLGECACQKSTMHSTRDWHPNEHPNNCPARPIRVSCSISGKTWEESVVTDIDSVSDADGEWIRDNLPRLTDACRDRWALVKALVTGHSDLSALLTGPKAAELIARRDAVFSALADMTRAEAAAADAQDRAHVALGDDLRLKPHHNSEVADRPSSYMLERYVERLIEQVGVMP